MTEKPNNESPLPEKLQIDEPTNFPFHAAYVVYSKLFDQVSNEAAKADLNRNIESLKQDTINYETFYRNISRYREMSSDSRHERFSLQTQRKRDWRKKSQKQNRIKRHKK